ncbi:hypothetical protein GCM10027053_03760 [Intrasporangium mesophilum]
MSAAPNVPVGGLLAAGGGPPEPSGLGPRAARLAVQLETCRPRRTVRLDELWAVWNRSDPSSAGRPESRTDLAAALAELQNAGVLTCSRTRDKGATPPLPTQVTLAAVAPAVRAAEMARAVGWRPELAWVVTATGLSVAQVGQLRAVNAWLRDHGHEQDRLSVRERSLLVFGHEKALEQLMGTGAFGPGRLSLETLRTFRAHPPLPSMHVGSGPVLLVVENADTFNSVLTLLRSEPGPVGHVAWGAGGAFEASVRSAGDLPGVQRVRYYGDLDADGLRIPLNAAATALAEGSPPMLPATSLYRRLLATRTRQDGQPLVPAEQSARLAGWVAEPDLVAQVTELLTAGVRVPQEALNRLALAADLSWVPQL